MPQPPGILLLDDGELDVVAALLDDLGLEYTRLRGGEIADEIAPPLDLIVATTRHSRAVRRGSPAGARAGRPLRIIAADEDSTAMRRMLRRLGFHLLVRMPCHESIWRLLVRRALYQGDERRQDDRVAVGSTISLGGEQDAVLMDISNRGCHIVSSQPLRVGASLQLELSESTTGGAPLMLPGKLVRVKKGNGEEEGATRYDGAMVFDVRQMSDAQQIALGEILNRWTLGPQSTEPGDVTGPPLPPCESQAIPGLMLDDETDPAIQIGATIAFRAQQASEPDGDDATDRRSHTRGTYTGPVVASEGPTSRVLMGRDLSAGGMRVERLPGLKMDDTLRLALWGPGQDHPFQITARVMRDDGEEGLALRFEDLETAAAEALEKLVACLPDVESLEDGEARGLGAIISEILEDE
jgi:hypothetical protein